MISIGEIVDTGQKVFPEGICLRAMGKRSCAHQ
jgi:hypothetical protein